MLKSKVWGTSGLRKVFAGKGRLHAHSHGWRAGEGRGPGSGMGRGQSFSLALPPLSPCGLCQPRGLQELTVRTWPCLVVLLRAAQIPRRHSPELSVPGASAIRRTQGRGCCLLLALSRVFQKCLTKSEDTSGFLGDSSSPFLYFIVFFVPSHPISPPLPKSTVPGPGSSAAPHSLMDSSEDGSPWG